MVWTIVDTHATDLGTVKVCASEDFSMTFDSAGADIAGDL